MKIEPDEGPGWWNPWFWATVEDAKILKKALNALPQPGESNWEMYAYQQFHHRLATPAWMRTSD
jgi:hypothetical protein